jgi:hypothetical protein
MLIKLDNGYGSEVAYFPNDFEVNYKQNQYLSQVSSVPLCPFFTLNVPFFHSRDLVTPVQVALPQC